MSFGDKRFGKKLFDGEKEPPKLTIERNGEKIDVVDIPYRGGEGKRINLEKAKEILRDYMMKVPNIEWVAIKEHFGKVIEDFSDKDRSQFKTYFQEIKEELKKAQALREKIVEKSNPAFNKVALYIHEQLKLDNSLSYEDIITSYFTEHLDEPILDDVTDEVMKKLEDVFPKIQGQYKKIEKE